MNFMKSLLFSFGFFATFYAITASAEEVLFQLKFEAEKEYLTAMEMKQTMVMPMAGQEMRTSVMMNALSSQKVSQVEKGVEVVQQLDRLLLDMDAAGMKMTFDSENPEGPMAALMAPMLQAKTTMLLGKEGQVLSVKADAAPGMENMGMGKAELEQTARELSDMMANRIVSEGESWQAKSELPLASLTTEPVSVSYTLTFEKMVEHEGHQVAKVNIKGTVDENDGNLQVTSKELSGEMLFDPVLGQPRLMTMTIDLEIGVPEGVDVAEGAPGKMPMKTETISRLKEVK